MVVKACRLGMYEAKGIPSRPRRETSCAFGQREVSDPMFPRKAARGAKHRSVPQTDTGGWGENPKALERTQLKELCKLAP